jgi:hypothetical protein
MHTKSVVASSLLGLGAVHAQSCPNSCQAVVDFSNSCANSVPATAAVNTASPAGWGFGAWSGPAPGTWSGAAPGTWSGATPGSWSGPAGSWSGSAPAAGPGSWLGGLGGWKKRSVGPNTVTVAANVLNAWSTTEGMNCMCANTAIYADVSSCISSCTNLGTLFCTPSAALR